jgi:hypothetical protein
VLSRDFTKYLVGRKKAYRPVWAEAEVVLPTYIRKSILKKENET